MTRQRFRLGQYVRMIHLDPTYPPGVVVGSCRAVIEGARYRVYRIGWMANDGVVNTYGALPCELMLDDGVRLREPSVGNLHYARPLPLP